MKHKTTKINTLIQKLQSCKDVKLIDLKIEISLGKWMCSCVIYFYRSMSIIEAAPGIDLYVPIKVAIKRMEKLGLFDNRPIEKLSDKLGTPVVKEY